MKKFQLPLLLLILPLTCLYAVWQELDSVPEQIFAGEGTVYGGGYVWAIAGETGDGFYAYDVYQNEWITSLENFPDGIDEVGAIAYETEYERRIFVVDDDELYFYTKDYRSGYEGSWDEPILLPEDYEFEAGTCITFQHADVAYGTGYLYLLRGGGDTTHNFFRRPIEIPVENPGGSPQGNFEWEELPALKPGAVAGAAICFSRYGGNARIYALVGGGCDGFYYYDINSDAWRTQPVTPRDQNDGSSLASPSPSSANLRAIFGEDSDDSLFRYRISDTSWYHVTYLPNTLSSGASIACRGNPETLFTYLVIGGGRRNFYLHILSTEDEDEEDGPQSSGSMPVMENAKVSTSSDGILVWYSTRTSTIVQIQVYDLDGKLVKNLFSEKVESGEHLVSWNKTDKSGRNVPAGIYFITIDKDKPERLKVVISK